MGQEVCQALCSGLYINHLPHYPANKTVSVSHTVEGTLRRVAELRDEDWGPWNDSLLPVGPWACPLLVRLSRAL